MQNPFLFGGEVTGSDFCGREKELAELHADTHAGQNVLIYASRRFGKTSLLRVLQAELQDKNITCMYADLSRPLDVAQFAEEYFRAFTSELGGPEKVIEIIKHKLNFGLSTQLKVSPTGETSWGLDINPGNKAIPLQEVIDLPFKYGRKEKQKIVVILDEFQEVVKLGLEAKLRSYVQAHGRHVSYLFAGSKKSILTQMFGDRTRPFFQSVKTLPLEGIPEEDWQPFIADKFTMSKKKISKGLISQVVTLAQICPYLVQHLCYVLWDISGKTVVEKNVDEALAMVLAREGDKYVMAWDSLSFAQQKMALVLAGDPQELYSKETLRGHDLTPSTAQRAVSGLLTKNITEKLKDGGHKFQDPFFKIWLVNRFQK